MSIGWDEIGTAESALRRSLRMAKARHRQIVLAACCLFVAAVSVHDAMLVVLHADVICEFEQNPVGRWLIEMGGGDVGLFVSLKLMGTGMVCATLVTLYEFRTRIALAAGSSLAVFQAVLLLYLTFAEC